MSGYADFLARRAHVEGRGFKPLWLPDFLFDFQRALVEWAIETGCAAIFADCGRATAAAGDLSSHPEGCMPEQRTAEVFEVPKRC